MKTSKATPPQPPARPPVPAMPGKLPKDVTTRAAAQPVEPPDPNQSTTEEAMEAWRNEGDPN